MKTNRLLTYQYYIYEKNIIKPKFIFLLGGVAAKAILSVFPLDSFIVSQGRSAAVRIPLTGPSPKAKRLEFRSGDALANPYLAFSVMMLAGIDGIKNQIDPGDGVDVEVEVCVYVVVFVLVLL